MHQLSNSDVPQRPQALPREVHSSFLAAGVSKTSYDIEKERERVVNDISFNLGRDLKPLGLDS